MEHTPGPWKVSEAENGMVTIEAPPYHDGNIVAKVYSTMHSIQNRNANAEFIVLACNSHDELLGACRLILGNMKSLSAAATHHERLFSNQIPVFEAVIAKVEGKI